MALTRCDVDESITDEVLKGIAFREGSAEFSFFFLTELSLKVNKFVLIPDAPVLLYKTLDKRSALAKAITKNAVYVEFSQLYDNQIPDWINNYVKEKKYVINFICP